jgi:hypothetical protein
MRRRVPIEVDFVLEEDDPNIAAEILVAFADLGATLAREAYREKAEGIPEREGEARLLVAKLFEWLGSNALEVDFEELAKAGYALGIIDAEELAIYVEPAEVLAFPKKNPRE